MSLQDLLSVGKAYGSWAVAAVVVVLSLLQVSKININPWSWLARKFGRAINGEVLDKVAEVEQKVCEVERKGDERAAVNCRARILRFGDEIMHGYKHSKDHFDQILGDIKDYEGYCATHKDFRNNITAITIERIKDCYRTRLEKGDFL